MEHIIVLNYSRTTGKPEVIPVVPAKSRFRKVVTSHLRLIPSAVFMVAWTGGLFHWHNAEVTMPRSGRGLYGI